MNWCKSGRALLSTVSISLLCAAAANANAGTLQRLVSPQVPTDIPGGAGNADILSAALFAWREFIALNWPAKSGTRDTPDETIPFGDPNFNGPVVWHTYRHKSEIYPGAPSAFPPGYDPDAPDLGYSSVPPQYIYGSEFGAGSGLVPPCAEAIDDPAFINLDEISQIGLNSAFAGAAPAQLETNKTPQLVRYLAKGNRSVYEYVVGAPPEAFDSISNGEPFFNHPQPCPTGSEHPYCVATSNFKEVSQGDGSPDALPGPVIDFPPGSILVKGAWRELTDAEKNSGRFYQTTVRYYEESDDTPGSACYREAQWGMVSMHIIQRTPTAPYFIFATYEQPDILLTADGLPVEDTNGRVIRTGLLSRSSTTPALYYEDGDPPILETVGFPNDCAVPEKRFFYQENPDKTGLPSGINICQNYRFHPIPGEIQRANKIAHRAIRQYNKENGIQESVWEKYRLTNVQWIPFDTTQLSDQDPDRSAAVYYLSDAAIETDYTLQQFKGRIDPTGPPTSLPANFATFDPSRQTYQNVLLFDGSTLDAGDDLQVTYNMGGCMGCHGVAQLGGNQFSFTLGGGRVTEPEAPNVSEPGTSNPTPEAPLPLH